MKQKIQKHFLFRIFTRLDLLLFLYILAIFVVYIVGNYKSYIDEILTFLLNSMTFLSIFLFILSVISVILSIVFFIREKKQIYLFYNFLFIFLIFFSVVIILLTSAFDFVASGMIF
jgi:hypothetical protein